jgi:hypothetical protein
VLLCGVSVFKTNSLSVNENFFTFAGGQQSEAERLAAAKSTKDQLGKGISLFNSKGPLKGLDFLMSQGLLESSPAAVSCHLCMLPVCICAYECRRLLN